ncbi:MAG: N-acetylmuramoyl-L-alanine amidase, partial [Candidatus Marinimicrobia bacterium]|nr:N-acetylmuramoyl-L-alanine amidase [Candidatus Neomarinimicrobiota bacterium]
MKIVPSRFLVLSIVSAFCITLLPSALFAAREYTVLIDPGHGGSDDGTSGTYNYTTYYEKNLNLDYANNLYTKINSNSNHPFQPFQARVADVYLSPADRVIMANNASNDQYDAYNYKIPDNGVDIFLSIHCNGGSATNPGTETLYYASSSAGMKLATIVHQFFMKSVRGVFSSASSRWVKTKNVTVLSATSMPAIIVETDFMSVQEALAAMITNGYKNAVGTGIHDALLLVNPEFKQYCWGFAEITGNVTDEYQWQGPILLRNTTSHGSVAEPINPEYVTYYQNNGSSLYIYENTPIVLDDKVIFEEGSGIIIDNDADLIIGEGSSFNGITVGIEDYVYITQAPNYLEQGTSENIVRAIAQDVEPYGNISSLSSCELYASSSEGDVLLSSDCSFYISEYGYWQFSMDVPLLSQWNNTWIRDLSNNQYIKGYFKVINGSIYSTSNVLIHSPYTSSGTIQKNEMWSGNISLTGYVTVSSEVTLTIIPGTNVSIAQNAKITVEGHISATGTSAYPIKIQSNSSINPLDIRNISQFNYCQFKGTGFIYLRNQTSTFSHCVFTGGPTIKTESNGTFNMTNCIVENGFCGMGITTGTPGISTLSNCTIRNNTSWGIKTSHDGRVVLDETEVYDNGDGIVVGYHGILDLEPGRNAILNNNYNEIEINDQLTGIYSNNGCWYGDIYDNENPNPGYYIDNFYQTSQGENVYNHYASVNAKWVWWGTPNMTYIRHRFSAPNYIIIDPISLTSQTAEFNIGAPESGLPLAKRVSSAPVVSLSPLNLDDSAPKVASSVLSAGI